MNHGATPQDWAHFGQTLGLAADLLPVVSNPGAEISPESAMKEVGKTPSRYNGSRQVVGIAGWTQRTSTPDDVAKWSREPDYGICIQTRHVRAIDVDVTDALDAELIASFIDNFHPGLPKRTRGNSSKFLLAFRLEGEFTKRRFKARHGIIEFLATGQQFVAVGTHPSGARYEWFDGLPEEFPVITKDQFEALWGALVAQFAIEEASSSSVSVKAQKLAEVHRADPVATYLLDKGWVRKVERDGRLHIACPWADQHSSESSESATTYWPAHTGGYVNGHFACLHAHCEHRTDAEFLDAIGYVDTSTLDDFAALVAKSDGDQPLADQSIADHPSGKKEESRNRFAIIPADLFAVGGATNWLIKGVLPKAELGVVFGDSGSGKTFQVLDMAASIARGVEWRGRKTKQGRVAYIAAEGAGGLRKRLQAYAQHHGASLADMQLGIIPAAPNLLQKADAVDIAKAVLAWGGADLIVVDTLAQTTPGGNENSGEDMGKALAHCRGIHKASGAMVLLVHHSGKDSAKGARGWSGLRAAADVEFEVSRADNDRVMTITKQKDGDDGAEFGFALAEVVLGLDDDGEAITSCVVQPVEGVNASAVKSSSAGRKGHGAVGTMLLRAAREKSDLVDGKVAEIELLDYVAGQLPQEEGKRDRRRERTLQAYELLLASGELKKEGMWVHVK